MEREGLPLRDIKERLIDAGLEAGYPGVGAVGGPDVVELTFGFPGGPAISFDGKAWHFEPGEEEWSG